MARASPKNESLFYRYYSRRGKALSAYELVEAYKRALGESLPAMSMYRILDFLISEDLVHRLELANKYVACEHISCGAEHAQTQFLICSQCQKVKEIVIDGAVIAMLKKNIGDADFHLSNLQLEMNGICKECRSDTAD